MASGLVPKVCRSIDFSKEVSDCLVKVTILVKRCLIFVMKECKSIDFSKEVCDFLVKVMILVRRSDIFEKKC